jgi:predicted DNA-binding protein YlxM (UPF0122 family)
MGFADLSIAEIAAEYELSVEQVFQLCHRFNIAYKNQDTCLPLEDAKVIIAQILAAIPDLQGKSQENSSSFSPNE